MSPALIFSYFKVWWGLVLFGLAAFGVGHRIVKAGVGLVLPVEEHCLKKLDDKLPIDRELEAIVAETVVEGCIGEALAALQARAQLDVATDPAVRSALEATIEDETRHAELAWKVVAWALASGGARERDVIVRTFRDFRPPPPPKLDLDEVDLDHFAQHGRLTPEQARAVALEALETVVKPCAAGLLEQDVFERVACTTHRVVKYVRAAALIAQFRPSIRSRLTRHWHDRETLAGKERSPDPRWSRAPLGWR